jgi:hypothetical protein
LFSDGSKAELTFEEEEKRRLAYIAKQREDTADLIAEATTHHLEPLPENVEEVKYLSGVSEWHEGRKVQIFRTAQNQMSSIPYDRKWVVKFNHKGQFVNPLMGWGSSVDPNANPQMEFDTAENAVAYAKSHGLNYTLVDDPEKEVFEGKKSYSFNFLSEAVTHEMKTMRPSRVGKKIFKFDYGCGWVNLPHSDYGNEKWNKEDGTKPKKK